MSKYLLVLCFMVASLSYASEEHNEEHHEEHKEEHHDEHGHGGGKAIGIGKAIEEVNETQGFKLSKEAVKRLKIKLEAASSSELTITKETLVLSKNFKGIYRYRLGFFKLFPVEIIKEVDGKYIVKVKGIEFGDQIAVEQVGLLRVSDIYSTDKSEYGHGH